MAEAQNKENHLKYSLKRTRSEREGEKSKGLGEEMEHRSKWQKKISPTLNPMVEVASQEWPHMDK